jgi:hypothetical protein
MDLFVFTADPARAAAVVRAGAAGVILDWERRGKARRQQGQDTQINEDTAADLAAVRRAVPRTGTGRVVCRVNGAGPWTAAEVQSAVALGADEVLLPMVRTPADVDLALDAVAGRCGLGILVETQDAVACIGALARRPLARVYLGLNDLRIDRGGVDPLFAPLVDGTADRVRRAVDVPFGVAGLTLPDRGRRAEPPARRRAGPPGRRLHLPAPLVLGRHRGPRPARAVPRIAEACAAARRRGPAQVRADRAELCAAWRALVALPRDRRGRWRRRREHRAGARPRAPGGLRRPPPVRPAARRRLGGRGHRPARARPAACRSTSPTRPPSPRRCAPPTPTSPSTSPPAGRGRRPPSAPRPPRSTDLGLHLVEALGDRCRAVVRLGSSTEYAAVDGPMAETAPLAPRGFFGATKAAGSLLLVAAAQERGVRAAVLRAFQVYGPGDHPAAWCRRSCGGARRHRPAADRAGLARGLGCTSTTWSTPACAPRRRTTCHRQRAQNVGPGADGQTRSSSRPPNGPPADRCAPPSAPTRAAPGTPRRGCATRRSPAGCSGGSPWSSSRTGCAGAGRAL